MKLKDIFKALKRPDNYSSIPQWLKNLSQEKKTSLLEQSDKIEFLDDQMEIANIEELNKLLLSIRVQELELVGNSKEAFKRELPESAPNNDNNSCLNSNTGRETERESSSSFKTHSHALSETTYKILLMGNVDTGKTRLMQSLDNNKTSNIHTIGIDFKTKACIYTHRNMQKNVKFQIWETAGHLRMRSLTDSYYRTANFVLLCINLDQYTATAREDIKSCLNNIPSTLPVFLIGTTNNYTHENSRENQRFLETVDLSDIALYLGGSIINLQEKPARVVQHFGAKVIASINSSIQSTLDVTPLSTALNCCFYHYHENILSLSVKTSSYRFNIRTSLWSSSPSPFDNITPTPGEALTQALQALSLEEYQALISPIEAKMAQLEAKESRSEVGVAKYNLLSYVVATLRTLRGKYPSITLSINNWSALAQYVLRGCGLDKKPKDEVNKILDRETGAVLKTLREKIELLTPEPAPTATFLSEIRK